MNKGKKSNVPALFIFTLAAAAIVLGLSAIQTNAFNRAVHHAEFAGAELFSEE